jgi:hypothetical protein
MAKFTGEERIKIVLRYVNGSESINTFRVPLKFVFFTLERIARIAQLLHGHWLQEYLLSFLEWNFLQ